MIKKEELEKIRETYGTLKNQREPYLQVWRKISEWIDPYYGEMNEDEEPTSNPLPNNKNIYDNTISYYSTVFSTGLEGYTCSSQSAFFELAPEDKNKNQDDHVISRILQERSRKMYSTLAQCGFYSQLHRFFKSFGDLGTAIMLFGVNRDGAIYYENVPIYQCCIIEDKTKNVIDTLFRSIYLTKYEAEKLYGKENLPERFIEGKDNGVKKYQFIQLICPRDRFETSSSLGTKYIELVWMSDYPDMVVSESGSDYLRFAVCPFSEGECGWGVGSPGQREYNTSRTLSSLTRDQLNASQLLSSPPIKKTEGFHVDIKPGGFITVPPGGDLAPLSLGSDLSWTQNVKQDLRALAKSDYFVDYFLMLSQYSGNINTATLAEGLQNEQVKMMTFFLDTLKNRFFEPVIDWTYNTMGKMGMFDDGYELSYKELQVDYVSPLYRLQKQAVSLAPTSSAMNLILPFVQLNPDLLAYVDFNGYIETIREGTGADVRVVRSKEEAEKIINEEREAERKQQEIENRAQEQRLANETYQAGSKKAESGSPSDKLQNQNQNKRGLF